MYIRGSVTNDLTPFSKFHHSLIPLGRGLRKPYTNHSWLTKVIYIFIVVATQLHISSELSKFYSVGPIPIQSWQNKRRKKHFFFFRKNSQLSLLTYCLLFFLRFAILITTNTTDGGVSSSRKVYWSVMVVHWVKWRVRNVW